MSQSMTTARDIPILITSTATSSSERRITPSWTIAHLKTKLEPVTGIAPSSQILTLRLPDRQQDTPIEAADEETVEIGTWPLVPYAEIKVTSTTPTPLSALPPLSSVPKYTMPESTYAALPSTVLAYKRSHKIGRFDPSATAAAETQAQEMWKEVEERNIHPPLRCRLLPLTSLPKHGQISYVGPIPSLPGPPGAPWIGITLDEPLGKNDGSILTSGRAGGKEGKEDGDEEGKRERYFTCGRNRGVFVRSGRVEVGEGFGVLGLGADEEDEEGGEEGEEEGEGSEMEEI